MALVAPAGRVRIRWLLMRGIAAELDRPKVETPRGGAWHPQLDLGSEARPPKSAEDLVGLVVVECALKGPPVPPHLVTKLRSRLAAHWRFTRLAGNLPASFGGDE